MRASLCLTLLTSWRQVSDTPFQPGHAFAYAGAAKTDRSPMKPKRGADVHKWRENHPLVGSHHLTSTRLCSNGLRRNL